MVDSRTLRMLSALERKVLWLSTWTIHNANHLRDSADGLKVGGHQASSASLATIMTALYFAALRPEDRVAVKPHASPIFHAIQYLLGNQSRDKLRALSRLRAARRAIPRAPRTSTTSISPPARSDLAWRRRCFAVAGPGLCARARRARTMPVGRMVALVGDAEMDEGNIFEALLEGWKHGLRNCWWVVDYNRQSLDAVVREGLWRALRDDLPQFRLGRRHPQIWLSAAGGLRRAGRRTAQAWIDDCPNQLYSAPDLPGRRGLAQAAAGRSRRQGAVQALIERRSDAELARTDDQSRRP